MQLATSDDVAPWAWLDDNGEVSRLLARKVTDTSDCELWWRVVDMARICRLMVCPGNAPGSRNPVDLELRRVSRALQTARPVAARLPWPPVSTSVDLHTESTAALAERLEKIFTALCSVIEDPARVDPDTLASLVDQTSLVLRAYGTSLLKSSA